MMNFVDTNVAILEFLGIDYSQASKVTIQVNAGEMPTATVVSYIDGNLFQKSSARFQLNLMEENAQQQEQQPAFDLDASAAAAMERIKRHIDASAAMHLFDMASGSMFA